MWQKLKKQSLINKLIYISEEFNNYDNTQFSNYLERLEVKKNLYSKILKYADEILVDFYGYSFFVKIDENYFNVKTFCKGIDSYFCDFSKKYNFQNFEVIKP